MSAQATSNEQHRAMTPPMEYADYMAYMDQYGVPMRMKRSLFSGVLWAFAAFFTVLTFYIAWPFFFVDRLPLSWVALVGFALTGFSGIIAAIVSWHNSFIDANGNGIPDSEERKSTLYVTVDLRGQGKDLIKLEGVFAERLPKLAREYAKGKQLTYENFGGKGKLFSQPDFKKFMMELRMRGIVDYINPDAPTVGFDLTPKGRGVFARAAAEGKRIEDDLGVSKKAPVDNFAWSPPPQGE